MSETVLLVQNADEEDGEVERTRRYQFRTGLISLCIALFFIVFGSYSYVSTRDNTNGQLLYPATWLFWIGAIDAVGSVFHFSGAAFPNKQIPLCLTLPVACMRITWIVIGCVIALRDNSNGDVCQAKALCYIFWIHSASLAIGLLLAILMWVSRR